MKTVKVQLYFVNNVMRVELPIKECIYQKASDILDSLYDYISCNGYSTECGHFALMNNISIHIDATNIMDYVKDDLLQLVFLNIIPLNNAKEYDRLNGIVIFFHTSEKCHLFSPHIHAKYADETIKIDLDTFDVIGSFSNRKKQREAIAYAINNKQKLLSEWEEIISQHN